MQQRKRILEIHRALQAGYFFYTAVKLAKRFGCNERTIRRDLEQMRAEGLPVEYDYAGRKWFYSHAVGDLPATLVTSEDRDALLVAQQAIEQFAGTPWYDRLKSAFGRILQTLPDELATNYEKVAGRIRFEGNPIAPIGSAVWKTICTCIEDSTALRMVYKTGHSGQTRDREVDAYGLVVNNREWYLVGWDHYRKGVRTFFLPRIKSAKYTDKKFRVKDDFDLDRYLATAVDSHQSTGPIHHVKLRFTAEAAPAGEDFIWNRGQKTSKDQQGRLIVEFDTGALYAVQRQVLSWGGGVEVMEPEELRRNVVNAAGEIERIYRKYSLR
jgi:predicted DNA-binding transcriptional regulator YafY